ncbi:hypothetical protein ACP4OV_022344 [Aristida adscensionis]
MCLRFDSCCGHDHDDGPPAQPRNGAPPGRTTTPPPHQPPPQQPPIHRNGYHGNGRHHPAAAAADDFAADRKASNGATAGPVHAAGAAAPAMDARAHAAVIGLDAAASGHAGADGTSKHVVGNGGGHGAHYYSYEREPAQEEHAAGHRYPATSIANHGRY